MKVYVEKYNNTVELPKNCVSGGEGDVYIKDNWAYKIYHDKSKSLTKGKFEELNKLELSNIIKPESLLYDNQHNIIGYMMKAIPNCYSLSRLITNDFRNQHNISNDTIYKILQKMRETIEHIHQKGCLIVDGNEMNYLVDENFENVYFIDVDSYKTKSYQANAYSNSTLDPLIDKSKNFSKESDWFAFGIISCSLLVGIHPFKGNYKGTSINVKKGDIRKRMELKRSIFNSKVSVNSAVRDFDIIPTHYKEWYNNLFEMGIRNAAPLNIFSAKVENKIKSKIAVFNEKVKSLNIYENDVNILDFIMYENLMFIKDEQKFINIKTKESFKYKNKESNIIFINNIPHLIKSDITVKMMNLDTKEIIDTNIGSDNVFVISNRIYNTFNTKLSELKLVFNKMCIENSWEIIKENLDFLENLFIQKIGNRNILYIPYEQSSCAIINMPELEGYRIINAMYKNRILNLVVYKNNKYERLIIKFNEIMKSYKIIYREETDILSINATTLINGVFLSIIDDEQIFMTLNNFEKDNINIINDKNIKLLHKLYSNKNDTFIIIDNKINKISLN